MELNDQQKHQLAEWLADGLSLSDIQRRMADEWKCNMTYMELRFLVDDLGLEMKDTETSAEEEKASGSSTDAEAEEAIPFPGSEDDFSDPGDIQSGVRVEVDKVQRPGAVLSGNVQFSDGQRADWQLDQMGRLGLIPATEGYQPSPEDVQEFQLALQAELQKQGF